MARFLDQLVVSPLADGLQWALMADFRYQDDWIIEVPKGFVTDFASIPQQLWSILPPWQRYGAAAVVHDWLYWDQTHTREQADNVLKDAMTALGVHDATISQIYNAVRLFGDSAWTKNAALKASGYTRQARLDPDPPYAAL